jgi:hypothetical protein
MQLLDDNCDAACDASKIIAAAMVKSQQFNVSFDDECLETVEGDYVHFELPRIKVRVKRSKYANQMAQHALEDVFICLSSAARAAAVME